MHQKCENNTLEEVLPASEGPWGGKAVNDQFIKFLSELVGEKVWEEFKKEYTEDYLNILRSLEIIKKTIKSDMSRGIRMPMQQVLIELCKESHGVKTFKEVIEKNDAHKNNVEFSNGKLVLNNEISKGFFKKSISAILKNIDDIFQEPKTRDIKVMYVVGDFSDCLLVQNAIKRVFAQCACTILPNEKSVLCGAVYLGHFPNAFSRGSELYKYFQTKPEFKKMTHPKEVSFLKFLFLLIKILQQIILMYLIQFV